MVCVWVTAGLCSKTDTLTLRSAYVSLSLASWTSNPKRLMTRNRNVLELYLLLVVARTPSVSGAVTTAIPCPLAAEVGS